MVTPLSLLPTTQSPEMNTKQSTITHFSEILFLFIIFQISKLVVMLFLKDYRMTIYLRQTWQDPRLKFRGSDQIVAQGDLLDKIWIPDTYFPSEKKSSFHEVTKKNYVLMLLPNGTVFFSIR